MDMDKLISESRTARRTIANRHIAVVGLGYVGLPVAVALGEVGDVIGFDINEARINELNGHLDSTREVERESLEIASVAYTTDASQLEETDFIIIAVPTPINEQNQPDLGPICSATRTVGKHLRPGAIVVYESTVYPGLTEEECIPLLERESGLRAGIDFKVGYSPERINPGDRVNTFRTIKKVVAAEDEETLDIVAAVYETVVDAGVHRASSIKVAEAAKVIENTQRDLNIALMNELAIIFERMNIDTLEVLEAAGTKWNFLNFRPGLVGGHCIGVDPFYLTMKSEMLGYHPEVILAGRRINETMGSFIATSLIKTMIRQNMPVLGSRVTVLGMSFKENVSDIRNSKVATLVREIEEFGLEVQVYDPLVHHEEVEQEYGIQVKSYHELKPAEVVIYAVSHDEFVSAGWKIAERQLKMGRGIVMDLKGILNRATKPEEVHLWRL
ncbi:MULTISPECIES: nucleotide sugar dehydrogenase [unclassified Exiguobacterium]|uniref:nucleotide sugar dehydrogenase n=1 Tax=unclassified Exiguobacterium TaxID=2644629 RepID=UPI001040D9E3|nr:MULTISPECIES: nucleotide sugar dehydrogenase [unclassified Exiguobacterium]TCI36382.1 nucleotide sugar dehydrogenase [Exiguobacterium sp. SH4S7]TCI63331.1 nucleotide sugar dehydrogenase [Exiguobacterium sp. SH0S2]